MPPLGNGSSPTSSTMYTAHAIYTPTEDTDNIVGNTQVYTATSTSSARWAMPFDMPEDGTIHSVSIYHEGGSDDMLLAVYSDDSGLPDQRLALTEETEIHSYAGWQTVQLTNPVDVNEGDTIWLAWVFETNPGIRGKDDSPNSGRVTSTQGWASGMPADFGSSTTSSWIYSIYANYTPDQQDQYPELLGNPYMFTGRRFDLETGLYYYRARYYNPYIGRFLQTDPIGYGDGMNWYSYCGNNPMNYVDPWGKFVLWVTYNESHGWELAFFSDEGAFLSDRFFTGLCDISAAIVTGEYNWLADHGGLTAFEFFFIPDEEDTASDDEPWECNIPIFDIGWQGNLTCTAGDLGGSIGINNMVSGQYEINGEPISVNVPILDVNSPNLDVGADAQAVITWGNGSYSGDGGLVNLNIGPFTFSVFGSIDGSTTGIAFGLGIGGCPIGWSTQTTETEGIN